MSLNWGVGRRCGRPHANTQVLQGERWSAKPRPGRRALQARPRTGGRMPPSSRTGMFGGGSRACCTRDGPGRARRRWYAARAPWTFVTRSVWRRSPGNQLGPRARSGDFRRAGFTSCPHVPAARPALPGWRALPDRTQSHKPRKTHSPQQFQGIGRPPRAGAAAPLLPFRRPLLPAAPPAADGPVAGAANVATHRQPASAARLGERRRSCQSRQVSCAMFGIQVCTTKSHLNLMTAKHI